MLWRIFVLVVSSGIIATCNARDDVFLQSRIIDCNDNGNSTACAIGRTTNLQSNQTTESRIPRRIEGGLWRTREFRNGEVTGRKKGKGKGYGKLLLYFVGAMKATLLYVMAHAVAAIAGKALILAKVALAIATAIAITKATDHDKDVTYEIVKHPHHSYVQTHSSSIEYDHHNSFDDHNFDYRKRRRIYR